MKNKLFYFKKEQCTIFLKQKEYNKAINLLEESTNLYAKTDKTIDKAEVAETLLLLARTSVKVKDTIKSIEYYNRAYKLFGGEKDYNINYICTKALVGAAGLFKSRKEFMKAFMFYCKAINKYNEKLNEYLDNTGDEKVRNKIEHLQYKMRTGHDLMLEKLGE